MTPDYFSNLTDDELAQMILATYPNLDPLLKELLIRFDLKLLEEQEK